MPTKSLTIKVFGSMQVLVAGRPLPRLRSRKGLWLLALLCLRRSRPLERTWLASALWPDADQTSALSNLRVVLSEIRTALQGEGSRIQAPNRGSLAFDSENADVDVIEFDLSMRTGNVASLARAVELYSGVLLEGCNEEWVDQERQERERACLQALASLGATAVASGDMRLAVEHYRRACTMDPWWDTPRRGLMDALVKSGDINEALQVYRSFENHLRAQIGSSPDQETTDLYLRIRKDAKLRSRELVGTPPNVPPTAVTGYLPHALTGLVGREDESAEVVILLRRSRLITLTGFGGIGKTRLALAVASAVVNDFPGGVWLVALESVSSGELVAQQTAMALGLAEIQGQSWLDRLTTHLKQARLLIVLDNCEHVVEASARLVETVLQSCASVKFLATSREPINMPGEVAWSVPALTVPELEHLPNSPSTLLRVLVGYEGVQLFVERARAANKDFALTRANAAAVANICWHVEGIPLALELAAVRVKSMTVHQIAANLEDRLRFLTGGSRTSLLRRQTLRASLDWSFDLLPRPQQTLLSRLSVFAAGWSLDAAERVCARDGILESDVSDLLAGLVDRSLVVFCQPEGLTEGRYRLLESVRQYALLHLGKDEETEVRDAHRDYYLSLAETSGPFLAGSEQGYWLARLEAERANLRAAGDWCASRDKDIESGLRLAGALGRFWELRGHYIEGRKSLALALGRPGAEMRTLGRASALRAAGVLAYYQGDHTQAKLAFQESLSISRELEDLRGIAWSLNKLGDVTSAEGSDDVAEGLYEESLALFRNLDDRHGLASLLHHLGRIARDRGELAKAHKLYSEGIDTQRAQGDWLGVAWALHHLGHLIARQGDLVDARNVQGESLAIFREMGSRQGVGWSLGELAAIASAEGDFALAALQYEESLSIFRELGNLQGVAAMAGRLGLEELSAGKVAEARRLFTEALAVWRDMQSQVGLVESACNFALLGFAEGRWEDAVRLWAAAEAQLAILGSQNRTADRVLEGLARAKDALGEAAFDAAWVIGSGWTLEHVATDVLLEPTGLRN